VVFDDHAQNGAIIQCEVYGKLVHVDKMQIIVRSWECSGLPDTDSNHEHYSIVKSCIKEFRVLR
jgi:hypothetical protein